MLKHQVASRLHQMCLAKPHTAIDEKRVIGRTRVLADLPRRRSRQLIGFPLHMTVEAEVRIQSPDDRPELCRHLRPRWHHTPTTADSALMLADLHRYRQAGGAAVLRRELSDTFHKPILNPLHYKAVGCQQPQRLRIVDCLQWPDPCVELLRRELLFQVR